MFFNKKFTIEGNIVDVINRNIFQGEIEIINTKIVKITKKHVLSSHYILPGLIDSHVHIESSMLTPSSFAKMALRHGTVATVSDPHEIVNVMGEKGIKYMLSNSKNIGLKIFFGLPSCVPATNIEKSGAILDSNSIEKLFKKYPNLSYLTEMMNFPGVIYDDVEVIKKIQIAHKYNKPIDGHAPGLKGHQLKKYIDSGIATDHECMTIEEAEEKIKLGMLIQIREGSAAKNFDQLFLLIDRYPNNVMLCCDDIHPDDLINGHINKIVKKGIKLGVNLYNLLQAAIINPINHYNLNMGCLRQNDDADFIIIDNLNDFNVLATYIKGKQLYDGKNVNIKIKSNLSINHFNRTKLTINDIKVKRQSTLINVINVIDKELYTTSEICKIPESNDFVESDSSTDILKLVLVNRYDNSISPSKAFVKNFGLKKGALASCIAHDNHNIIAVGTNDDDILDAINTIILNKGGICAVNRKQKESLLLEIGGIMTSADALIVSDQYKKLNQLAKDFGSTLTSPFMTLSFLSLIVIPELKIGEKGLFDVNQFKYISLFK